MKKQAVSVFLVLCMTLLLLPTAAAAPQDQGKYFSDVAPDAYYYTPVQWAVQKGIGYGTGTYTFSPEMTCTKAQILTFLWRSQGQPEPTVSGNPFVDVYTSDYYFKALLWAAEKGMITKTTVRPNDPCTRAMVVNYLWRLAGKPAVSEYSFTDVPAGEDAQAVAWAVSKGITNGTGNGTFSPNAICTRGQIVTFLYRVDNPGPVVSEPSAWAQAYIEFLENQFYFGENDYEKWDSTFQLAYIDGDAIPELVVGLAEPYHAAGAIVYTYYGGQVVEAGEFGASCKFAYIPSQNMISGDWKANGGVFLYFYRINDGREIFVKSFEAIGFYTLEYKVDDQIVSRDYYENELRKIDETTRYQFMEISAENGMPIDDYYINLIRSSPNSLVVNSPKIESIASSIDIDWILE